MLNLIEKMTYLVVGKTRWFEVENGSFRLKQIYFKHKPVSTVYSLCNVQFCRQLFIN